MKSKISRRTFLERSSKGLISAAVLPYLLKPELTKAFNFQKGKEMKLPDYYEHFGVDTKLINEVIADALSKGGDYCDLFFQHKIGTT